MKLHQICEDDLKTLEELIPQVCDRLQLLDFDANGQQYQNEIRVKIRRLQKIVVDIRWNYGPPEFVKPIPAGDDPPPPPPSVDWIEG